MSTQIETINENFQSWLYGISMQWEWSIEDVVNNLGINEIINREDIYPELAKLLSKRDWTIADFKSIAQESYVLGERFFATRLNSMLKHEQDARKALNELLLLYPDNIVAAAQRINNFISIAVELGFKTQEKTADNSGATVLASVLLSVCYPDRFVDFRQNRWRKFALLFGYPELPDDTTYGEKLIWAGQFANQITQTTTYQQYWANKGTPLWIIAGLCWKGIAPEKPKEKLTLLFPTLDESEDSFPEGQISARLHIRHERNQAVIRKAKKLAFARDPLLHCEVCGFSFIEKYGKAGKYIIDAHHSKIPIAKYSARGETKVKDIALICSNCHRIIHAGKKTLTLEQLRELLNGKH